MDNPQSSNSEHNFFEAIDIDSFPQYTIEGITQRRILNGEINCFIPIEIKIIPHYKDPQNRVNIIATTSIGDAVISRYEKTDDNIVQELKNLSQNLDIERKQGIVKKRLIYTKVNDGKWIHFTQVKQ